MKERVLVIAGNRSEGDNWIKADIEKRTKAGETTSWHDYYYVSHADGIKGFSDPHGVFIGTWRDRDDILEIVETLYHSNTQVNTSLHRVLVQVRRAKRKHNKLTPVPNGWVSNQAIQDASELLAKAIDEEVMKNLMNKINGGNI